MTEKPETKPETGDRVRLERVVRQSGRYPYTFAADYLRTKVGDDYGKGLISRGAAACCHHTIAKVLGMDEEEMAKALAEAFINEGMA